jgi:hypothetical protein
MTLITQATADILLAAGGVIGVVTKAYALLDTDTVWSRKSSGLNVIAYPVTGILPYFVLELYLALTTTILNALIWTGIFLFRHPNR